MTEKYNKLVTSIKKSGKDIHDSLTNNKCDRLHMAIGISGEAGELLDAVKKHVIYEQELDIENVIEELGDLEFYMEGLRQALCLDRETILNANYDKLMVRYNGKYSNSDAQERKDKV